MGLYAREVYQRMDFNHDNVRRVVEEDKLSRLPDELIHKILYSFDMRFVVQTCVLSSRWKLLWTSMPNLNFSSGLFSSLPKFSKFVTNVLSHRNHQIEVSFVKLDFNGAASQFFVRKIAKYAFSHNAQQLMVCSWPKNEKKFPPCLFSSQSLKHFTLSSRPYSPCVTPTTPWDFPALTTLYLSDITLSDHDTGESLELFSKCVNLKNLTIKKFFVDGGGVFDIITPRLSNLTLIDSFCRKRINLGAPQLENLTIIRCSIIKYLNAPLRLSSLYYEGHYPMQLPKDQFHSLDKVFVCVYYYCSSEFKEEDARNTIEMLQGLHCAKYLTLNWDIVECISSFSDLLSQHTSPFSNLICLTIGPNKRKNAYKVKMSTEARNFFLVNSPDAIMELPEEMKQKEARAAEIESHMKELQTLIEQGHMIVEQKEKAIEKAKSAFRNLMAELPMLSLQKIKSSLETMNIEVYQGNVLMGSDNTEMSVEVEKGRTTETERLMAHFKICVEEMWALFKEEYEEAMAIYSKEALIRPLWDNLPKRESAQFEGRYLRLLKESKEHCGRVLSQMVTLKAIFACEKLLSDEISTYQDVSTSKLPLALLSQSSSSTMDGSRS